MENRALINHSIINFESFTAIGQEFAQCMHDYLYVYDIPNDTYYISPNALDRFNLQSNCFHNVIEAHRKFVHPEDFDMLSNALEENVSGKTAFHNLSYRWLDKNLDPIWIHCVGKIISVPKTGVKLMIGCINEIGQKQLADNTSGLLGSSAIQEILEVNQSALSDFSYIMLGIDELADIEEHWGITYCDHIIRKVSDCIQTRLTPSQCVFRLPKDSFLVVDFLGSSAAKLSELYQILRTDVDALVEAEGYKSIFTLSAGLLKFSNSEDTTSTEIMSRLEFALSHARELGKNQVYSFNSEDYQLFLRKKNILSLMRQSISQDFKGFFMLFQPIVHSNTEKIFSAEALLRFQTPDGELISPIEFIPLLEESSLIVPVGRWVIHTVLDLCAECQKMCPDFKLSFNVSYIQLLKSPLHAELTEAISKRNLSSSCLILELTESGYLEDSPSLQNTWSKLKAFGIRLALDDFGTGYSNLHNIADLKPSIVKIDRKFAAKALHDIYEYHLLEHVIHMVHYLGQKIVIEGIETSEELDKIRQLRPDFIQGFYFSKPLPPQALLDRLSKEH